MSSTVPRVTTHGQWKPHRPELVGTSATEIATALRVDASNDTKMAIGMLIKCLNEGHKVLWFGNGGSAAQADHFSAELMGRFRFDRPPLASINLVGSPASISAIANDYGYSSVFSRQVEALGRSGDVAVGLTTSGESENVLQALKVGGKLGMGTVAMVGHRDLGDPLIPADIVLGTPGLKTTAAVQQRHLEIGHTMCNIIERILFGGE